MLNLPTMPKIFFATHLYLKSRKVPHTIIGTYSKYFFIQDYMQSFAKNVQRNLLSRYADIQNGHTFSLSSDNRKYSICQNMFETHYEQMSARIQGLELMAF